MEGAAAKNPKMEKWERKKLSMEDYLDCFTHRRPEVLNVLQLNQIMSMHGFRKHKGLKKDLVDAVSTIELMDLCRSTLMDGDVSGGGASLTLDEVIRDLKSLDWQECHVTSLLTLDSTDFATNEAEKLKPRKKKGESRSSAAIEVGSSFVSTGIPKKARTARVMIGESQRCSEIDIPDPLDTRRSARGQIPNRKYEGLGLNEYSST